MGRGSLATMGGPGPQRDVVIAVPDLMGSLVRGHNGMWWPRSVMEYVARTAMERVVPDCNVMCGPGPHWDVMVTDHNEKCGRGPQREVYNGKYGPWPQREVVAPNRT